MIGGAAGLRTFKSKEQVALLNRLQSLKKHGAVAKTTQHNGKNRQSLFATGRIWKFVCNFMEYDPDYRIYKTLPPKLMFLLALILSAVIAFAISLSTTRLAWVALPLIFIVLVRIYLQHSIRRFHKELFNQFPDALGTIVRCIRVGISVPQAIEYVANSAPEPTKTQFAGVAEQLSIGAGMEEALARLSRRNALQEYKFFAVSLSLQAQTGGSISETLDNLSEIIRKRVAATAKAHALISEAKMSIIFLAILPFFSLALMSFMNYSYMKPLFSELRGKELLASAFVMWVLGLFFMRTLIQRTLS